MALQFKAGSFVQQTGTGQQAVPGVGFQGKAGLFWSTSQTADGVTSDTWLSWGVVDSAGTAAAFSVAAQDNVSPTVTTERSTTSALLLVNNLSDVVIAQASFVSWDADGFTVNWTTNDAVARIWLYAVWGGDSLTNTLMRVDTLPAATGNISLTGFGFQPDFAIWGMSRGALARWSMGLATSSAAQGMMTQRSRTGVASSEEARQQRTDRIYSILDQTLSSPFLDGALVSFDADGVTINRITAGGSQPLLGLYFKGGLFNVGAATSPTAAGTQALTGLGGAAAGVLAFSFVNPAATAVQSRSNFTLGAAAGTSQQHSVWGGGNHSVNPSQHDRALDRTSLLKGYTPGMTPVLTMEAKLQSLDSDGVTLNWTTVDSVGHQYLYAMFGPAGAPALPGTLSDGLKAGETWLTQVQALAALAEGSALGETLTSILQMLATQTEGRRSSDEFLAAVTTAVTLAEGELGGDAWSGILSSVLLGTLAEGSRAGDLFHSVLQTAAALAEGSALGETLTSILLGTLAEGSRAGDLFHSVLQPTSALGFLLATIQITPSLEAQIQTRLSVASAGSRIRPRMLGTPQLKHP